MPYILLQARRMSEMSSKDYPYAPASSVARSEMSSDSAPPAARYQRQESREEGKKHRMEYVPEEHISSRYF